MGGLEATSPHLERYSCCENQSDDRSKETRQQNGYAVIGVGGVGEEGKEGK